MKLLRQLIKKKYEKYNESVSNKKNDYWDFFQAYNLVCVVKEIKISMDERKLLNNNWKNWVLGINTEKSLAVLENFVQNNTHLIANFLKETELLDQKETRFTGLYEKGRNIIGVASYEFENILGR